MPAQEILDSYKEFSDSYYRLLTYSRRAKEDFEIDNVVKRFKMTFDLLLKNLSFILKQYKVSCKYPSDYIKSAAKFGIIHNETIYLLMLDDKYKISNQSNSKITGEVYKNIKTKYLIILRKYLEKIEKEYIRVSAK